MAKLSLRDLDKLYGDFAALKGINLDIADGEFAVFVGPSGCGKSTLLRVVAGLEDISSGQVLLDDEDVSAVEPANRGIAMVFQSYALYPHMTVTGNMAFGLKMAGLPRDAIVERVRRVAEALQITELLDRKPRTLSGGQRQRVAIGRAIVREPKLFLFDEPLSNLDAALRVQMRVEIARLHQEIETTMIYVTHDQVEAMTLADKIVVLNQGRVEQVGSPIDLYRRPANLFVAGFIGSPKMNMISAPIVAAAGNAITLALPGGGRLELPLRDGRVNAGVNLTLGLRPEHLREDGFGEAQLPARVIMVEHLGSETHFHCRLDDGSVVVVKGHAESPLATGETIQIGVSVRTSHVFGADGAALT